MAVTAFLSPVAGVRAQEARIPDKLVGHWVGEGTFFSEKNRRAFGTVQITLDTRGGSAIGRVGDASFHDARILTRPDIIEVKAPLLHAADRPPTIDKKCVVFVITAGTDSTLTSEFHLKSNCIFDPVMREGKVTLRRTGPSK